MEQTQQPSKSHLFEQIHEILWDRIRAGEIVPGQRLRDLEWAQKLNVSRTPVREAMRKMQQEGILTPIAQGGYEVRPVSRSDLVGLYRCRAAMEALATEDAAAKCDDRAGAELEALVDRCDEAIAREELDAAYALNTSFHRSVIAMSDNEHLRFVLESLRRMIEFYRAALLNKAKADPESKKEYVERLKVKQQRHREIVAALRARDGARAARLMEGHIRETAEDLLPAIPEVIAAEPSRRTAA
jgi:DNA-binding GntR family transcriptional regulator